MSTTEHFRQFPEYYDTIEEAKCFKTPVQTNPRYKTFTQTHFTAGDEEQFETFRNKVYFDQSELKHELTQDIYISGIYKNPTSSTVIDTFRYIFHKFKKGIFIQIRNNKLKVMLPFSKHQFTNEWSDLAFFNPELYSEWNELFKSCSKLENRNFKPQFIHKNKHYWYNNNGLIRYEYPIKEQDSGVCMMSHMFNTLCNERIVPDIEFFVNRRDFPLLKNDHTEPYDAWYGDNTPLLSHCYNSYTPILSMCRADNFADIPIPTWSDWGRVMMSENKYFPKCQTYDTITDIDWNLKKAIAVFRGSTTGQGTNIETNKRMKLAHLSSLNIIDNDNLPFLDAGITSWNSRPRKNGKYIETLDISSLKLVPFLSLQEQSQYKYIINVEGHVCAFRLSVELSLGCVVLIVESKYKLWYSHLLEPYVHYIPIKEDLSDIFDVIKWCKVNDDKCKQIAENARQFWAKYLQKHHMLDTLQEILWNIKTKTKSYNYPIKSFFEIQHEIETKWVADVLTVPKDLPTFDTFEFNIPPYKRTFDLLQGIQWYMIKNPLFLSKFPKNQNLVKNNKHMLTHYSCQNDEFSIVEKSYENQELMHETCIGLLCINDCLKNSPNFCYTYGLFNDKLYLEYIKGLSLFDHLKNNTLTFHEWMSCCIQICFALCDAQQRYGFVHQDLYPWNVMITFSDIPVDIYYVIGSEAFKVTTKIIPIIIDYGKSHAIIKQRHIGKIRPTFTSTIQDVCCFVISSIYEMFEHSCTQSTLFNIFQCFKFFSDSKWTNYRKFTRVKELKEWLSHNKRFSTITQSDKGELESKTPLDFAIYLHTINSSLFEKVRTIYPIMRQGTARHVYMYLNKVEDIDELVNRMNNMITNAENNTTKQLMLLECVRVCKSLRRLYPKCDIFIRDQDQKHETTLVSKLWKCDMSEITMVEITIENLESNNYKFEKQNVKYDQQDLKNILWRISTNYLYNLDNNIPYFPYKYLVNVLHHIATDNLLNEFK